MTPPGRVRIVEVGPRDGLQNEKEAIPLDVRIELVNRLTDAGFANIEVASFEPPTNVSQLAMSSEVMEWISRGPGVLYSALIPDICGLKVAVAAKVDEVVLTAAASEAFTQRSINCSIAESIERLRDIAHAAKRHKLRLRGSIKYSFGCPYQGEVTARSVAEVARRLHSMGCIEIGIEDTMGVGTPRRVQAVLERVAEDLPIERLSGHFYNTYGQAIPNICASLAVGVSSFQTAVAGLGVCEYSMDSAGNVATEDVLSLMHSLGIETGIDLDKVLDAAQFISPFLRRSPASRVGIGLSSRK